MKVIATIIITLILANCHFIELKTLKTPTPICTFPDMEPWTDDIRYYINWPDKLNCTGNYPFLFRSNATSLIPESYKIFKKEKIISCCYRQVLRAEGNDSSYKFSSSCEGLSLKQATKIPLKRGNEYISIECLKSGNNTPVIVDFHVFPLETLMRYLVDHGKVLKTNFKDKLNVLVLMIDAVSRMNFIRMMPKSYKFLMNSLSGLEMKGFNRLGQYTHDNLLPQWMGIRWEVFNATCKNLEKCKNFIWNDFSNAGYMTGYNSETTNPLHLEPYEGFLTPPVHFYNRHATLAMEEHIGNVYRNKRLFCAGPRNRFRMLLEWLQKILAVKENMPFPLFIYTLVGIIGHDDHPHLAFGDKILLSFLKWYRRSTYFKNTVMILVADHGLERGELKFTQRGYLESNLPMLYFVLPPYFKRKYERAFKNLEGNRDKLTTHFDLYETLKSLVELENLEDDYILKQEGQLDIASRIPRGINLFLPVPITRTCGDAEIDPEWCSCLHVEKDYIPLNDPLAHWAANLIVLKMNELYVDDKMCAKLHLNRILYIYRKDFGGNLTKKGYMVGVETTPGYGQFEAIVRLSSDGNYMWVINWSSVYRTNPVARNKCKKKDFVQEKFCHCLEI